MGRWTIGRLMLVIAGVAVLLAGYVGLEARQGCHDGHARSRTIVAFADGSAPFISDTINPRIFEAFSTIAGGEKIPPPDQNEP